jgi:hypothetical protein
MFYQPTLSSPRFLSGRDFNRTTFPAEEDSQTGGILRIFSLLKSIIKQGGGGAY